jgi:tripartite-type tricarboxylate transporter receptor subunit TctC
LAATFAIGAASAALLAAMVASIDRAAAQVYPSRPITIAYPFAPAGPGDVIARLIVEPMRASLGQPVIVENVAGANGTIGTGRVARAAPNGYTLVLRLSSAHALNGAIYALPYDVLNDFEPISLIADSLQMISAKKALPANDSKELIAWPKANPDKTSQGYAGAGSPGHVAGASLGVPRVP